MFVYFCNLLVRVHESNLNHTYALLIIINGNNPTLTPIVVQFSCFVKTRVRVRGRLV